MTQIYRFIVTTWCNSIFQSLPSKIKIQTCAHPNLLMWPKTDVIFPTSVESSIVFLLFAFPVKIPFFECQWWLWKGSIWFYIQKALTTFLLSPLTYTINEYTLSTEREEVLVRLTGRIKWNMTPWAVSYNTS